MAQEEPEPEVRERDDLVRAVLEREADGFAADERDRVAALLVVDVFDVRARVAAGFDDRDLVLAAFVDRDRVVAAFVVAGRGAAVGRAAPGRSSEATRRASDSISPRSFPSSSRTPCCSSDSRTLVTARATSSTIWAPRSFEPSGNARSTALRTASTVSAAPEPFLSFFFFPSFLAMARV
jgi:hypothetical protein